MTLFATVGRTSAATLVCAAALSEAGARPDSATGFVPPPPPPAATDFPAASPASGPEIGGTWKPAGVECSPPAVAFRPHGRTSVRRPKARRRVCDPDAPAAAISRAAPLGAAFHATMGAQVANGDAAQTVLYEYDFFPGEARLNCRGKTRLYSLAGRMRVTPFPLLIQPTLVDPALDEARRAAVAQELTALEPSLAADRVIVGFPPARGLDGVDAVPIHARLLRLSAGGTPGADVPAEPSPSAAIPSAR